MSSVLPRQAKSTLMLLPTEAMVVAVGNACVRGPRMLSSMASFMHDVSMV